MKKRILFLPILTLIACGQNVENAKAQINSDQEKIRQDSTAQSEIESNNIKSTPENSPNLNFEQLYPYLKNSLIETVCEACRIEEENSSLHAYSIESDAFLSSWEWDLSNKPLLIEDIDNDGLIDYTIELFNAGGGCGGQIGESERWTLFGSRPNRFEWTHIIPYRSETGNWEKR
jgi:hypothetical protein